MRRGEIHRIGPAVLATTILAAALIIPSSCAAPPAVPGWETSDEWELNEGPGAEGSIRREGDELVIEAYLDGGEWIEANLGFDTPSAALSPLVFGLREDAECDLEVKLVDSDGTTFWRKIDLRGDAYPMVRRIVLRPESVEYAWGGDTVLGPIDHISFALSGGSGDTNRVFLSGIGWGGEDDEATFPPLGPIIDPNAEAEGFGRIARRDETMDTPNNLVLEWLRIQQDYGSPERALVPSLDLDDNIAHTFNNALVAMAFMVEGERERAERILDFYADAADRENTDPLLQNFFLNGEPRGFFQSVYLTDDLRPAYHSSGSDRWMGDMCWLLFAYEYHARLYGPERYREMRHLIGDLLVSWFIEDGEGGYVGSGWRNDDDHLHESSGHPEGNIDAYAAFRLIGEDELASRVGIWLDRTLSNRSGAPLDHYTWRLLAFGPEYAPILDLVEHDLRYRKTVRYRGELVTGVYAFPEPDLENLWTDGMGHLSVAYSVAGDTYRADFYANQMDLLVFPWERGGLTAAALPYAANNEGPHYAWVDTERGAPSPAAWYIFAKNRFNPMTLERY